MAQSNGIDAETAFMLDRELVALQVVGRSILAAAPIPPEADPHTILRLRNWVGQVSATLTTSLPDASYLRDETQHLTRRAATAMTSDEVQLIVSDTMNLLVIAQEWVKPDHRADISEALERKIYEALVRQYFTRWPWYLLATALVAFSGVLVGGTVWAGYKVDGVLNQAEAAKKTISDEAKKATEAISGAKSTVDEAIQKVIDDATAKAKIASDSKLGDLQNKLDAQLRENQTASQKAIDETVGAAKTQIEKQEKLAAQALSDQQDASSAALAYATGTDLQMLSQTLATQTESVTQAVSIALANVNGYATNANSDIDKAVGIFTGYTEKSKAQIDQAVSAANGYRATLEQMVDTAKTQLPNEVQTATATLRDFDQLVANYRTPLEAFIARSAGDEKLSGLAAAAIVLGWTRWLVFGALAASIIASVLALAALMLRLRRRNGPAAPV